jgi:hypothetical protein
MDGATALYQRGNAPILMCRYFDVQICKSAYVRMKKQWGMMHLAVSG